MEVQPLNAPVGFNTRQYLLVLAAIAFVFGIYPLAGLILQHDGHGFVMNRTAPDFELRDARGKTRSLKDYRGRNLYLMFGYMRCADVCHTQVTHLAALGNLLGDSNVEFLYLAMDTRHDDPTMLHAYFDQRGTNFTSLHADSMVRMQSIANAYGAGYRVSGNPGAEDYEIEHPAKIFLIDAAGKIRFVYNATATTAKQIAADFEQLN